jgi:hypothetical protein
MARCGKGRTYLGVWVFLEARIENGVGDLVANLVGMLLIAISIDVNNPQTHLDPREMNY